MRKLTLRTEVNGGEYYGFVVISNIGVHDEIKKEDRSISIGEMKIEFDEYIDIIAIE